MGRLREIFLDIETDWYQKPTVVGFYSSDTGPVQLIGRDITRRRLLKELPRTGRLYTYNGHCFDLPCIRTHLGLALRDRFESWDLRWICQRHGLLGGQKAIERRAGYRRVTAGMDGLDAIRLWDRYRSGDATALDTLCRYNADDVRGLVSIKRHLARRNRLWRP